MESNPWRPLGEVVKWGVPCEVETKSGVFFRWTGERNVFANGDPVCLGEGVTKSAYRLHFPETVESVLGEFATSKGGSCIGVGQMYVPSVYVWLSKVKSVEHAKRIREAFLALDNLIKE